MARPSFGTQYDAQIAAGIRSGKMIVEVARSLGVSHNFTGKRGHALGLSDVIYKNGVAGRRRQHFGIRRATTQRVSAHWRKFVTEINNSRGDRMVSDVARSLRSRPADLSDAAIAALHERGLTIDELCAGTCRSPLQIIRAVREAARCS